MHLIILGNTNQIGSQTLPRALDGSPLTTEPLDLTPRSFMSFSTSLYTHCSLLSLLTLPTFILQNARFSCLKAFAHALSCCFTSQVLAWEGSIAFRKHSLSFSSPLPLLIPSVPPISLWSCGGFLLTCLSSHRTVLGKYWAAYFVVVLQCPA